VGTIASRIANANTLEEAKKTTFERWSLDRTSRRKLDEKKKERNREWEGKIIRLSYDASHTGMLVK
jgi:flagellar basal body rod protein FlgC